MRFYLDTEFNGFGGELISLALVGPAEWYRAVQFKSPVDHWVKQNVMPVLNTTPIIPELFRHEFHEFIKQFQNPEIICDWHVDAEHFCRMLAGKDYGTSLDFSCRITILKTPPGCPISVTQHNALSDARALRDWHSSVMKDAA